MEYLSQALVMVLALLGAFFTCVQTTSTGAPRRSRFGLPIPTTAGVVIAVLLVVSFGVSLCVTWQHRREEAKNTSALRATLDEILNRTLRPNHIEPDTGASAAPHMGTFLVRNHFRGEISLWVDGQETVLQAGQATTLPARSTGSSAQLYSCGWEPELTSPGLPSGCRFLPYVVLPNHVWVVDETATPPRIVMHLSS